MKETITVPLDHYQKLIDLLSEIRSVIANEDNADNTIDYHFDCNTIDDNLLFEMETNVVNRITNGK